MTLGTVARSAGTRAVTRRLMRSWPIIGGAIALLGVVGAIRRKGFFGGTVDSALNAVPIVGTTKNLLEMRRGRDFIPERAARPARPRTSRRPDQTSQ